MTQLKKAYRTQYHRTFTPLVSRPVAEASDRLTLSSLAIRKRALFTPGRTRKVNRDVRFCQSSLFCERALPVSDTERRSPFVPGAGWDEAGGAVRRTALSCHPPPRGRSSSTDASRRTTFVSGKESRKSIGPSGPTAEGPAEAARSAGPREEKTCPLGV
jgi:hypothetical protein